VEGRAKEAGQIRDGVFLLLTGLRGELDLWWE